MSDTDCSVAIDLQNDAMVADANQSCQMTPEGRAVYSAYTLTSLPNGELDEAGSFQVTLTRADNSTMVCDYSITARLRRQ